MKTIYLCPMGLNDKEGKMCERIVKGKIQRCNSLLTEKLIDNVTGKEESVDQCAFNITAMTASRLWTKLENISECVDDLKNETCKRQDKFLSLVSSAQRQAKIENR